MKHIKLLSTIKPFLSYFILVALFSILFISVELMNGKLYANDFKVYYGATIDFFQGNNSNEQNIKVQKILKISIVVNMIM
jgi:hypothetical protein